MTDRMTNRLILVAVVILLAAYAHRACAGPPSATRAGWFAAANAAAGWTPAKINDLALWLDASDDSTLWANSLATVAVTNGGIVARWDDKSGRGNHAIETSSNSGPTKGEGKLIWNAATPNRMVVSYAPELHAGSAYTVWVALKHTAGFRIMQYGGGSGVAIDRWFFSQAASLGVAGVFQSVGFASGSWTASGAIFSTAIGNIAKWTNGSLISQLATTTPQSAHAGDLTLGYRHHSPSGDFGGEMGEIILVSTAITADERQKIEGYLAHKWGLAANLPSGHPYKSAAP